MEEILNFFVDPYRASPTYLILLEFIAMVLGIASVIYAKKENKLVFPTGFVSTSIYIYILAHWAIYGDMIINIYYTIMSIYGWYMWSKLVNKTEHIAITRTNKKDKLIAIGIFLFASIFIIIIYRTIPVNNNGNISYLMPNELGFLDSIKYAYQNLTSGGLEKFRLGVPFIDTFTTATAFVAMWLMTQKKIENWTFWIVTNILSIPLYFVKGLGFTAIQYIVFLILAILGYLQWKKYLNKKK